LSDHLAASGLPSDAGDSEPFAVVKILYLPYPIPNTRARKRAVRIHDLNHLVSGYATDRIGELEISAWELASGGCRDYVAAWVLDLAGLLGGLMVAPRRTLRAFRAGTRQQNLYPFEYEELLTWSVDHARRVASKPLARRGRRDAPRLRLAAYVVLSIPVLVVMTLAWYVLVPAWLVNRTWPRDRPPLPPTPLVGAREDPKSTLGA
jgi:hypothetical protein